MPYEVLKRSLASFFPPVFFPPPHRTSSPSAPPTALTCISLVFITCALLKTHKPLGQNIYFLTDVFPYFSKL